MACRAALSAAPCIAPYAAREPVLKSKLSTQGGGLSLRVSQTLRASSVDVRLASSVSGFIVPGLGDAGDRLYGTK